MSTITSKIQIYVAAEHVKSLTITMNSYQKACNWLSEKIFETKILNQIQINKLYYYDLRNLFGLKSQMAQSVMKTVIARYKSTKTIGHEWTLVRFKKNAYDLVWNRDYSLSGNRFSVNTLDGRLKFNFERKQMQQYFDGTWKFGTAKLVYKFKKWFLHIPMTKEVPELDFAHVKHIVGIDLGINFLATTYDSQGKTIFYNGRRTKHKRGQYKTMRKQLQTRQTSAARSRLNQTGQRENRYITDVNHQVTKALVEQYPKGTLFVLEDLRGVRNATEKVQIHHRYVSVSWAFYQFRMMLEYKALLHGQRVLLVNPRYTSQSCPKCGHIGKGNRNRKKHTFCCEKCQYTSNDDRIGAMNLYRKGIEFLAQIGVSSA